MYSEKNINKLYRYESLLQAIDFFAQKFDTRQIASYALDFANEILSLNSSALFVKEGSSFKLVRASNYDVKEYSIPNNSKLQRIATFYGSVLSSGFENYFSKEDIEFFKAQLIIPLIIQDLLFGFIISNGKAQEAIVEDDLLISKALMQLINNSLENSKNFFELQEKNKQLDQKVFNLFSINQSSRMLLSELDLNKLYSLAIDIFSELTCSKITSFGLYDEIEEKIIIRGYRDVYSTNKYYNEFRLLSSEYKSHKVVYHYERDYHELSKIFENCTDFTSLEAEYIILIVKKNILGFVTISKPVNDRSYDDSLFELIESLAASTYISLANAKFFQEIHAQKSLVEHKLNILTKLKHLAKNISSCQDIDELTDISVKTLQYGFGIKKAFIALKEQTDYVIKQYIGFTPPSRCLPLEDSWLELDPSEMFYKYTSEQLSEYFDQQWITAIDATNCLVIAPIYIESLDLMEENLPLGYIVVLHTPEALKEEELLLIETISSSISPVINSINQMTVFKSKYMPDMRKAFLAALENKLKMKRMYSIDFYVYYKKIPEAPFAAADLSAYEGFEYFYFDNTLFVFNEETLASKAFDGVVSGDTAEEIIAAITLNCGNYT